MAGETVMSDLLSTSNGFVAATIDERPQGLVATVALDNPAKRNALSPEVTADIKEAFETLSKIDELRVAVLAGGELAFSAGADINAIKGLDPEGAREYITGLHLAINSVRECPVPVIARMHKVSLGGALELAAACDLRIGDSTVVIGMPEVKVGIPSVIEAALLPNLVGWGKAREMVLLGANYTAQESYDMGFLQKLVDPGELDRAVGEWVEEILDNGPLAMRSQKALIGKWEQMGLSDAVQAGIDHFAASYKTDEPDRFLARRLKK